MVDEMGKVAPGFGEGMLDHLKHPIKEAKGESPNDVAIGLTHDDPRKANIGHLRNDVLHLARRFMKTREWKPEGLLDLARIQHKFLIRLQVEGVRGHHQPRYHPSIPDQFVNLAEVFRVREFDADLFVGLSRSGKARRNVAALHPTPRKGHVAGPRIAFKDCSLDQQDFGGFRTFPQDDCDGGLLMIFRFHEFRSVSGKLFSNVVNIHAPKLSGPIGGNHSASGHIRARVRAMDLPRAFIPEARRLLKLARNDRRAAERELAALSPELQATVICEASLSIRRQMIELLPNPEEVIPLIPEAEFCYTCRSIGLEDASWLLPMATNEQLVTAFDLDVWSGLTVDPVRLESWMTALADSEDETVLRAAQSIDPELLVIYLRQHVDVSLKPSEQDNPDWSPPDRSQTLEGQFYFVAKDPKDDLAPLLRLLHSLFQGDYWLYFRAIQAVLEEMQTENEEWALRWRTGRLEDLGFPSWDASMRIYGFLRPDRLADVANDDSVLDFETWSLPVWISELPGLQTDERALFRATRELTTEERSAVFYALIALSNRVAVADRMELGDPESLPVAIEKATRYASDGLEFIAKDRGLSLAETLRRVPIERLFRVGSNLDREAALPRSITADEPEEPDENELIDPDTDPRLN